MHKLFRNRHGLGRRIVAGLMAGILAILPVTQVFAAGGYLYNQYSPGMRGGEALQASSNSLTFAQTATGATSAAQAVTITNASPLPLLGFSLLTGPSFGLVHDCPTTLAAGASCQANVASTPQVAGASQGLLLATYGGLGQALALLTGTGTGEARAGALSVSPNTLAFGETSLGSVSLPQDVTLSNIGGATLSNLSHTVSGNFSVAGSSCTTQLTAGASCSLRLVFAPHSAGALTGALTISSSDRAGPNGIALSGTGVQPVLSLSSSSVAFGNVAVGEQATLALQVQNIGTQDLHVSTINISGQDYTASYNCATIAPNATCTINITFTPQAGGSATGYAYIVHDGIGSPSGVPLTGAGLAPAASVSTGSVAFGGVVAGATLARAVAFSNTGNMPVTVSEVSVVGAGFSLQHNCATVAVGASCQATVTFSPTALSSYAGELQFVANVGGSPFNVSLAGSGVQAAATLSTSLLAFGNVTVGQHEALDVTVTSSGLSALTVASATVSGAGFALTSNGCTTVAAGSNCAVRVTYSPTAVGASTGTLTITHNGPSSPATVSLTGAGIASALTVSSSSLAFGSVNVGTSAVLGLQLTNSGGVPINISGVSVTGAAFASTYNCATIAALGTCTVNITFAPQAAGAASGSITITHNGAGGTSTASLSGTGVATSIPQAALTLSSTTVAFGSIPANTSTSSTVTLTNSGNATLNISSVVVSGSGFSLQNNCGATLAASASCTVGVTFAPATEQAYSGTLTVTSDAPGAAKTAALSGTGSASLGHITFAPTSLEFGNLAAGGASAQSVTVTNSGTSPLTVLSAAVSGAGFTLGINGCSLLAIGATCTVAVNFQPVAGAAYSGTLQLTHDGAGGSSTVALSGTGLAASASLSAGSLAFGSAVGVGTTSAIQQVTLTNTGNAPLTLSGLSADNAAFGVSSACGASLAPTTFCLISVTFSPTATQAYSGTLSVATNAATSPNTVALSGAGAVPLAGLSTGSLDFGNIAVGASSLLGVQLTNSGGALMTVASATVSGLGYSVEHNCTTLAPGVSCQANVTFAPTADGAASGTLTFNDDAGAAQHVTLTGTGTMPIASFVAATTANFGTVQALQNSILNFTLTNSGHGALTIASIVVAGPAELTQDGSTTCSGTLAGQSSCNVAVRWAPTVAGTLSSATVTVTDNAAGSPRAITLTGTSAAAPVASLSATTVPFASVIVGNPSTMAVQLHNTGNAVMALTSVVTTGAGFSSTTDCNTSTGLAIDATCTTNVTFAPTGDAGYAGTLTFTDSASGSPHAVALSGTGLASVASLTADSSASFGNVAVGQSATRAFTLSNLGHVAMTLASVAATGSTDLAVTANNCGSTLAAAATCAISVRWTPLAVGALSGAALVVTDSADGSPHSLALSGSATGAPIATLSTSAVGFGPVTAGTTAALAVRLTNDGNISLHLSGDPAVSGAGFSAEHNCTTLAPGAYCTVNVTFTPTDDVGYSGNLQFADDASGSPQTVTLSGTGLAPVTTLTAVAGTSFGTTDVGDTSMLQFTLANTGHAAANISAVTPAGSGVAIDSATTCGTTLAAANSCIIWAKWTPSAAGVLTSAYVRVTDNATGSPHSLSLSGASGIPVASLSAPSVDFGNVAVGMTNTLGIALSNTGSDSTLAVSDVHVTGAGFTIEHDCATIATNAHCTVNVTFTPTADATASGTLTFTDNGAGSPRAVTLSGAGQASIAQLSSSSSAYVAVASPVDFSNVGLGSSQTNTYYLRNSGHLSMTLGATPVAVAQSSADATGNVWRVSSTACNNTVLAAGSSCAFSIAYWPITTGADNGGAGAIVTATTTATGGGSTLMLTATGTGTTSIGQLSATSGSYTAPASPKDFGSVGVGSSQTYTYYIRNTGTGPMTLGATPVAFTTELAADVSANVWRITSNSCASAVVAAGSSCAFSIAYWPTVAGADNSGTGAIATVTTTATGGGTSFSLTVNGTGTTSIAQLSSSSSSYVAVTNPSDFGNVNRGSSGAVTYYVYNGGTASMTLGSAPFAFTTESAYDGTNNVWQFSPGTCSSATITAGHSCTFTVTYVPALAGADNGGVGSVLTITTPATGGGSTINLTVKGTGVAPVANGSVFTASTAIPSNMGLGYYAGDNSFYAFDAANTRKVMKTPKPSTATATAAAFTSVSTSALTIGVSGLSNVTQGPFIGSQALTVIEDGNTAMKGWFVIYNTAGTLITLTGASTKAVQIPSLSPGSITSLPVTDGTNWYICGKDSTNTPNKLWVVSSTDYSITGPITMGGGAQAHQCAVDPSTGTLWAGYQLGSSPYTATISQVNKSTGAISGTVALSAPSRGAPFPTFDAYGQMYAYVDYDMHIYRVNKATGAATYLTGSGFGWADGSGANASVKTVEFIPTGNQNTYFTDMGRLRVLY
jgi:hypothetical protein